MSSNIRRVLVVGSGAIGLRTSVELLRRGVSVVLRSAHEPLNPKTCSVGAGGLWYPFHCDDARVDRWALETLEECWQLAASSAGKLVEILPKVLLKREHQGPKVQDYLEADAEGRVAPQRAALPEWTTDARLNFQHLSVEMLGWQNTVHKLHLPCPEYLQSAGYHYAWIFDTPVIDAPRMLMNMLKEVQSHPLGGNVQMNCTYASPQAMLKDALAEKCDAVVNCTGLASRTLFPTESHHMVGGRGVVLNYDRATTPRRTDAEWTGRSGGVEKETNTVWRDCSISTDQPTWGSWEYPVYLIPRNNLLLVGGTYLEGDEEPQIRPHEQEHLEHAAHLLGLEPTRTQPLSSWVGFRPVRNPNVRLEVDDTSVEQDIPLVHNYGHGGSGWTVYVGAAREVCSLLGVEEAEEPPNASL